MALWLGGVGVAAPSRKGFLGDPYSEERLWKGGDKGLGRDRAPKVSPLR